ncbi:hypothetical protein JG688_00012011 [Phytophthora aleatoria]|uniref:Uncharacterized protein n=1 Tax=Phytophthora aleatoria TaxID=2496075 RepID=A0A8J5IZQ5_9STRA|nr:hypothetical protein JG688_00012011 [Phytophthora aleatoria]
MLRSLIFYLPTNRTAGVELGQASSNTATISHPLIKLGVCQTSDSSLCQDGVRIRGRGESDTVRCVSSAIPSQYSTQWKYQQIWQSWKCRFPIAPCLTSLPDRVAIRYESSHHFL